MKLAIGTAQFGLDYGVANVSGQVDHKEGQAILHIARHAGLNTIDTAVAYGASEQALGQLGMASWRVISKLPPLPDDSVDVAAWVDTQVQGSLGRLKVAKVAGLLLHRPQQLFGTHGRDLLAALQGLKSAGVVEKIGVSIYDPQELAPLLELASFDLVQAPLNILDQRLVRSGWASTLRRAGVELHTRSVFLQGLLLMSDAQRPAKFNAWAEIWQTWSSWLQGTKLTPIEACLRYAMSVSDVSQVVVGVDSARQLEEILKAGQETALPGLPEWPGLPDQLLINPARWNEL